jgi:hypothetical protein
MSKTGRNDPCPCGSGKKYKHCCLVKNVAESVTESEESIRFELVKSVLLFAKKRYGESIAQAFDYFWDDFDPQVSLDSGLADMADINFWEWLAHDWRPEGNQDKTLIELYITNSRGLREREITVLDKLNTAVLSLYEVQQVYPEQGLLLYDVLLGKEYQVKEVVATRSLKKWDVFATRLLHIDSSYIMSGCAYSFHRSEKEIMLKHLKKCFLDYKRDMPESSMSEFLKRNGDLFNYYWCEQIRVPLMPTLVTTSGEPLIFCSAEFEVVLSEGILDGLRAIDALVEAEETVFDWIEDAQDSDASIILGRVTLSGSILRLQCQSKERLERGKHLLLDHFGNAIQHKVDTLQDPYQAMEDVPKSSPRQTSEMPGELQQELYSQYISRYYDKWLNEKIPALDLQTPLEAVRKPRGKKQVKELLKSIENMEELRKQRGEPYVDLLWLWEKLGIRR